MGMQRIAGTTLLLALMGASCGEKKPPADGTATTVEAAKAFAQQVDRDLRELWTNSSMAQWTYATDITDEHAAAASAAEEKAMEYIGRMVPEGRRFDGLSLDEDTARQLHLFKQATVLPAPSDAEQRTELAGLVTRMEGIYGTGKYCKSDDDCRDLGELEDVLATSRDWDAQLDAWMGWRTVSPQLRPIYARFVELGNAGSTELGYADLGDLWRSGYDMPPAEVEKEADRLWAQVRPLYEQLHCHVRAELAESYGADRVPLDGPIPAHLLGNMWSQSWENLYPMLEPYPGQPSLDVSAALVAKGYGPEKMVQTAEGFFTSLGLTPLPPTFWERSMLTKPEDREAVCHASAWDVNLSGDVRIKMCIKPTMEDFITIHHELGHIYYYLYYYQLPVLYQSGAHDGFHEGIGDTLALSVTPQYLHDIGLLDEVNDSQELVLNKQMQDALAKIAFLPFGRMIDQWRWEVFDGRVTPDHYNERWWELRGQYQGIASPVPRSEDDFDPGAKYHIPANTPYLRYFFAHVLQFQFHKALCEAAGHTGPLHTCSIYGSEEAGQRLSAMLAMGASKPWPDALEAVTGTREMDAAPLVEYFQPLMEYLEEQNKGRTCGW